jgi:hypothetical protein
LATSNISVGSVKTSFLSISLSGAIEVEVATITAVLSAPAFGRDESSSNADGFGSISSNVCMGDGDDDLAIADDILGIDCVVIFSEVILTGLEVTLLESIDTFFICSSVSLTNVSDVVFGDGSLIGLELALSAFHTFVSADFGILVTY